MLHDFDDSFSPVSRSTEKSRTGRRQSKYRGSSPSSAINSSQLGDVEYPQSPYGGAVNRSGSPPLPLKAGDAQLSPNGTQDSLFVSRARSTSGSLGYSMGNTGSTFGSGTGGGFVPSYQSTGSLEALDESYDSVEQQKFSRPSVTISGLAGGGAAQRGLYDTPG